MVVKHCCTGLLVLEYGKHCLFMLRLAVALHMFLKLLSLVAFVWRNLGLLWCLVGKNNRNAGHCNGLDFLAQSIASFLSYGSTFSA